MIEITFLCSPCVIHYPSYPWYRKKDVPFGINSCLNNNNNNNNANDTDNDSYNNNNGNFIYVFECTIVNLTTYRQFTNAA